MIDALLYLIEISALLALSALALAALLFAIFG